MSWTSWLPLGALLVIACGDNDPDDGPISRAAAESVCRLHLESFFDCECELEQECPPPMVDADDVAACATAVAGYKRTDPYVRERECVAKSCPPGGHGCLEGSCEPTATHLAFEDHCVAVLTACQYEPLTIHHLCETDPSEAMGPFASNVGYNCLSVPDAIREIEKCLDSPCDDIPRCMLDRGKLYHVSVWF